MHSIADFQPSDQHLLRAGFAACMQVALVFHDHDGPAVIGLAMHPTRFIGSAAADVVSLTSIEGL